MNIVRPLNPWLPQPDVAGEAAPRTDAADTTRRFPPVRPLAGMASEPESVGPGFRPLDIGAPDQPWWWLGCHGGAGVSTLAMMVPGGRDAERLWPLPPPGRKSNVVLVARTNADGLHAAQSAARMWAAGRVPGVTVLGLVTVADARGRLPRQLTVLRRLVGGGVPRVWPVPWFDALRFGRPLPDKMPKRVRVLEHELGVLSKLFSGPS